VTERTRLAALAERIGCSEGQLYTMTIGAALAIVLGLFGLSVGLADHPVSELGATDRASVGVALDSPLGSLTAAGPLPAPSLLGVDRLAPAPAVGGAEQPGDDTKPGTDEPPPPPCSSQPLLDATNQVLDPLGTTGLVPSDSTKLLLAHLTGCRPSDPLVLALGVLAETGSGIPDPGVAIPVLPIPFVELPQPVIDAMQPFREIIDPTCDAVGASATVAFYGLSTYPAGIDVTVLTGIRTILLVCGQLRPV
jgi:hypothetical protein